MRGFMRCFGNRIIAHAFVNRCQLSRAGDLSTVSALNAAQHDSEESLEGHNKQL